jgi:FkbM family methyltransferase
MNIRHTLKQWLLRRGIVVSRPPGQFNILAYKLAAAKARGLDIRTVVDGGAAHGTWTRELRTIWPAARVLAVEPRDEVQPALEQTRAELGDILIARELLGEREGETTFYIHGDQSSVNKDFAGDARAVSVPMTTLDRLVERLAFPWPDLIKLDLQGAELSALRGAPQCLAHARAVFLEVSFIDFEPGMPLIADVFTFMKSSGFVPYDVTALWHRPLDWALAQGDVLFLREDSPLRADRRYDPPPR